MRQRGRRKSSGWFDQSREEVELGHDHGMHGCRLYNPMAGSNANGFEVVEGLKTNQAFE